MVPAAKRPSEPGEFRRDSYHATDNHHGRWPDAFFR